MSGLRAQDAKDVVISFDAPPALGGAHTWLYEVYRRWSRPVLFVTRRAKHEDVETLRQFDAQKHQSVRFRRSLAPITHFSLTSGATWRVLRQHFFELRRLIGGDPVRFHCVRPFYEGIIPAILRRLHPSKAKLIVYVHGEELNVASTSGLLKAITLFVLKSADLVIVNSQNTASMVDQTVKLKNMSVIHPGVKVTDYHFDARICAEKRQALGVSKETVLVFSVARMEQRKNHAGVIRAVARGLGEGLPIMLVMASEGPEYQALVDLTQELKLEEHVRFLGRIDESEKKLLFASADIHMMPSIQSGPMIEGFGIVFLEAAAACTASIAGNSGGQSEAVRHQTTGFVVDGENQDELYQALRDLCTDVSLREKMAKASLAFASQHDWQNVVERTDSALQSTR